jgi:hypothetical protein
VDLGGDVIGKVRRKEMDKKWKSILHSDVNPPLLPANATLLCSLRSSQLQRQFKIGESWRGTSGELITAGRSEVTLYK